MGFRQRKNFTILRRAGDLDSMIRELDEITLTFSLWEQSRKDLHQLEEELIGAKRRNPPISRAELEALDARLAVLKVQNERLLGQALNALREYTQRGNKGS
jgi:hypothetical protein